MQDRDCLLTRIETERSVVGIRKDGIVHVYFKPGSVIDARFQQIMLEIYQEITQGVPSPFIFEGILNVRLTKEARKNALQLEGIAPMKLSAVFVKNRIQQIIANFYYTIKKPQKPYIVVTDFQKGIIWLLETNQKMNPKK